MTTFRAMLALALLFLGAVSAAAQVMPEGPVLAAADLRESQSLDGTWTYSIDPYGDGVAGFHGDPAGMYSHGNGHQNARAKDYGEHRVITSPPTSPRPSGQQA